MPGISLASKLSSDMLQRLDGSQFVCLHKYKMYLKCTAKKVLFQKIGTTDFMSDHSPGEEHVTCLISAPSPDVLEDVVKVFHYGRRSEL